MASNKQAHNAHVRRLVVKVGSSTLTTSQSSIDYEFLADFCAQIASVRKAGWQVVVVTSAAIACGLEALGVRKRPGDMPSLQAAASVGQSALSAAYAKAFAAHGITTSTVLLTRKDTKERSSYLNAKNTLCKLCELGVVPIINENDTVATEQIHFGDNDTLAALTACLIDATNVVILSDVNGLYDKNPNSHSDAKLISNVSEITPDILECAGGVGSAVGSGGMQTKISAARVLMAAGISMTICFGRAENVVYKAACGQSAGTRFEPAVAGVRHEITPRKLWIALGDSVHGELVVDAGAKTALQNSGSSLLVVGVSEVHGRFCAGSVIDIKAEGGCVFARGKVAFSSDEIDLALGKTRAEIQQNRLLETFANKPVVHRNDLIIF